MARPTVSTTARTRAVPVAECRLRNVMPPGKEWRMGLYERAIRPLLFRVDAERMHDSSVRLLRLMGAMPWFRTCVQRRCRFSDPRLRCQVCGLQLENPIGLAAGYDKNGAAVYGLAALGFGFLEIGSVSLDPSPGNPKPRLFRLPRHQAIVVNYGLPNVGIHAVKKRLEQRSASVPIGLNLVNTNRLRSETEEEIVEEFAQVLNVAKDSADYLVLNLSCPNTESGRECFADRRRVIALLDRLDGRQIRVPLFLKVSPRGGVAAIESLLEAVDGYPFVSGFIFNTPGGKPDDLELTEQQKQAMPGAVTGPVHETLMNESIANLYRRMDRGRYVIVGVGGVFTAEGAYRKIRCGASLVQLLTALVYRGPTVVRSINQGLARLLERDGFANVRDAVGTDVV